MYVKCERKEGNSRGEEKKKKKKKKCGRRGSGSSVRVKWRNCRKKEKKESEGASCKSSVREKRGILVWEKA